LAAEKESILTPAPALKSARPLVAFEDWGLIRFAEAWERQRAYVERHTAPKLENRLHGASHPPGLNHLIFCQHPHVYTLGKSGDEANLLIDEAKRSELTIDYFHIERGGDITYHGPGQLVGYPIFDLEQFKPDLHAYLRGLETAMIAMLAHFGLQAEVLPGLTGVWIEPETERARKIAAIGIKCSRWVTMHGFALNVETDLSFFDYIVPCGIRDKGVTSMRKELGEQSPSFAQVSETLRECLRDAFGFQWVI